MEATPEEIPFVYPPKWGTCTFSKKPFRGYPPYSAIESTLKKRAKKTSEKAPTVPTLWIQYRSPYRSKVPNFVVCGLKCSHMTPRAQCHTTMVYLYLYQLGVRHAGQKMPRGRFLRRPPKPPKCSKNEPKWILRCAKITLPQYSCT